MQETETTEQVAAPSNAGRSGEAADGSARAGICVRDITHQRLLESLVLQLELLPVILPASPSVLAVRGLDAFELIIADEALAAMIYASVRRGQEQDERPNPALLAVRQPQEHLLQSVHAGEAQPEFEGMVTLPEEPAIVLAQLSVILYAHRAYVRRYHSTIEELNLNRRIFRSVTNGITVADARLPDMPLVYVNPAFEVMTGYSLEEVQGKNCRFLQGGDDQQPGLTLIREALRTQREVVAVVRNYRKNGTSFWNELSISPIRNREGQVTHFVGIQMDVTARVEFEAALRESEKLAAVGRLAASIAHEINNPLESVMNLLYLAQNSDEVADVKQYLSTADKELQRVAQITSQSLRFYRQSTKPQAARAEDMLDPVLDLYQGKMENARVTVARRQRASGPVVCLESEIRQVLSNLVRNAIDAMQAAGGRLTVRTRGATDWRTGSKGVLITVADTGTGISADSMKHLYTAFFTTKGISGTGLGLWVSREIVDRHQGRLRVRSSQRGARGCTLFQLFLPYIPSAPIHRA